MEQSRYISSKAMLRNIMGRLGIRTIHDLPIYDIMTWMGEGLAHIGTMTSLEESEKTVKVNNFRGDWPEDMYHFIRIKEYPKIVSDNAGFTCELMEGDVTLVYNKFPVDDDGYPAYPNVPSVIDALTWYVAKFLVIQGKLPNKQIPITYCDQEWQWYCGQARAEGFAPTMDQWERIVNVFRRLIPLDDGQYAQEFAGLESAEDLTLDRLNDYRYGRNYRVGY